MSDLRPEGLGDLLHIHPVNGRQNQAGIDHRSLVYGPYYSCHLLILKKILFYIYLFLRDRAQVGEGQRERETQNPEQAELSA